MALKAITKRPIIPLPGNLDPALRRAFDAIAGIMASSDADTIVTVKRLLVDMGLGQENRFGYGAAPGIIPNMAVPPAPTGLKAEGAFRTVLLSWDGAPYANHRETEIFRGEVDNVKWAVSVGSSLSTLFSDTPPENLAGQSYFYGIRFISTSGIAGPFNVGTVAGSTSVDPGYLLGLLTERITSSELHNELLEPISLITADDTIVGSIDYRIAAETQARNEALLVEVEDRDAAISTQEEIRVSAESALALQISLITAGSGSGFDPYDTYYFDGSTEGWSGVGAVLSQPTAGWLRVASSGSDPQLQKSGLSIVGSAYPVVKFRIKRIAGSGWQGTLYYSTAAHAFLDTYAFTQANDPVPNLGDIAVVEIAMDTLAMGGMDWIDSTITGLRLDLGNTSADVFEIDWLTIGRNAPAASFAALAQESAVRASADTAEAEARATLSATVDGQTTAIQIEQKVRAATIGPLWLAATTYGFGAMVMVANGDLYQSLAPGNINHLPPNATYWKPVTANLYAQYGVKLDVNGKVSGFGMANDGSSSAFEIVADSFAIHAPPPAWSSIKVYVPGMRTTRNSKTYKAILGGTNKDPATQLSYWTEYTYLLPFTVDSEWGGAVMDAAFIKDATITNAKIGDLNVDKLISTGTGENQTKIAEALIPIIHAEMIDSRGLSIKDALGHIIFSSGGMDLTGLPGSEAVLNSAIQVGGRNLFPGYDWWVYSGHTVLFSQSEPPPLGFPLAPTLLANTSTVDGDIIMSDLFELEAGKSYVLSFWAKSYFVSTASCWIERRNDLQQTFNSGAMLWGKGSGSDAHYGYFEFQFVNTLGTRSDFNIAIGIPAGSSFIISACKLQEGTKSTTWEPSPETVQAYAVAAADAARVAAIAAADAAAELKRISVAAYADGIVDAEETRAIADATAKANAAETAAKAAAALDATAKANVAATTANWTGVASRPTSLATLNSTDGTKLTGIAPGATVGATWGFNVGGANKPADNATVGATIGVNLSGKITATNASTFIEDLAIRSLQTSGAAGATGKRIAIYDSTYSNAALAGEIHVFDTPFLNAGAVQEIVSIGRNASGSDSIIGLFGTMTTGAPVTDRTIAIKGMSYDYIAIRGESNTGYGLSGSSWTKTGVSGDGHEAGSFGVYGSSYYGTGVAGFSNAATAVSGNAFAVAQYDFKAIGNGINGPFTGAHDGMVLHEFSGEIGDILLDEGIFWKQHVSNTVCIQILSFENKQSNVIGILSGISTSPDMDDITALQNWSDDSRTLNTIYKRIVINSLGEGQLNVCRDNGNIEAGDYICSSNRPGKGMKQDDDLLHNYTVAKARENCIWLEDEDDIRMIACTYHCG